MIKAASVQEKMMFLYKFCRFPGQIGSVTPSSKYLSRRMTESIEWDDVKTVAELGAGTGAITKYMESSVREGTRVLLFERDGTLRSQLRAQYPEFVCYPDATRLRQSLQQEGIEALDCIISGLPFANFPQSLRDELLQQIVSSLKPGGLFVAFQYSHQMKKQLRRHFEVEHIHFVPFNIPPAFVYVCRKK